MLITGHRERCDRVVEEEYNKYIQARVRAKRREIPPKPADKPFKQKNPELGILNSYEGKFPDSYWAKWTRLELSEKATSWVNPELLREEAEAVGIDQHWIDTNCQRLIMGADIGCRGQGRAPTRGKNSPTAAQEGVRLADSLQTWVKTGIVAGPFREEELPWDDFTTSPLLCRRKPDNSVRVILDMSAPHVKDRPGKPVSQEEPRSVNDGINKKLFPTKMSSTLLVLDSVHKVGVPLEAIKVDWASAYKHLAVRLEDRKLQVITFGGRYFVETQCTFGCSSSPGLFDSLSYLILEVAIRRSRADREAIQKQLDDVVGFGVKGTGACGRLYTEYRAVCQRVGVQLAPEDDPEKAFGPSVRGVILGVYYDFERWEWKMPVVKMIRLVRDLDIIVKSDTVRNDLAQSVVGRLTHYRGLVRNGDWERGFLLKLPRGTIKERKRKVTNNMKVQARWWQVAMLAADEGERIPDRRRMETLDRAVLSTDAAGGSGSLGVGMGGCVMVGQEKWRWFFCPWPQIVRHNMKNIEGIALGQKLSMLEGVALLTGMTAAAGVLAGRALTAYTDNMGFIGAWKNKNSPDLLTYTVAKALKDVAEGLGVNIAVRKVRRRSDPASEAADALSKCDFARAFENMANREEEPLGISKAILQWLKSPVATATLGREILREVAAKQPGVRVRDWRAWEDM